jgi:hypothetical protein
MKKIFFILLVLLPSLVVLAEELFPQDFVRNDSLQLDSLEQDTLHTFILAAMSNAVVYQDSAITHLLEDRSYNRQRGQQHMEGFRVQVYASNQPQIAKNEALNLYDKLSSQLNESVYVVSEPPFWKVRIGDFLTREEALVYKMVINEQFPDLQGSTYVVPDQVTLNN